MEAEFRALLTGDAAITALVGSHIYWNNVPQEAADLCVRLSKITGAPGYHMGGSDRLESTVVQIDVRALTVSSMWAVRDAIKTKLDGFKGLQDNIVFQGIFLRDERQTAEKPGTVLYHRSSTDWDVYSGFAS